VKRVANLLMTGSQPPILVLTNANDFKRVMAQPWLAKTSHFAVHHLVGGVALGKATQGANLSSARSRFGNEAVDNYLGNPVDNCLDEALQAAWAGYVVPKRQARRAVTRNLIRRQMRQALFDQQRAEQGLPGGIWVLRLRQGFDRARFPSAASPQLKHAVHEELRQVLAAALGRLAQRAAGLVVP